MSGHLKEPDSKSGSARSAGSSPARGTTLRLRLRVAQPRSRRRSVSGHLAQAGSRERIFPGICSYCVGMANRRASTAKKRPASACQFSYQTMAVSGNCPRDVADIVDRTNACRHFESEPYDLNEEYGRERKKFLDKNIRELRCWTLADGQKAIKAKYKNNLEIVGFLKQHGGF